MMTATQQPPQLTLGGLLGDATPAAGAHVVISDLSADSRSVTPGSLFLACAGRRSHGLDYVAEAIRGGAVAVAWEPAGDIRSPELPEQVVGVPVAGLSSRVGGIADRFFDSPSQSLRVAAVTGTNGKTSCAYLLANALERAGLRCGLIGTLGYGLAGRLARTGLTTPDAVTIHRVLAEMRDAGARYAAVEVSSHALDQGRVDGMRVDTAMFTNLSHDHLDYHGDLAAYGRAKARLFGDPAMRHAVINAADSFGRRLLQQLPPGPQPVAVCAATPADYEHFVCAACTKPGPRGLDIQVESSWGSGVLFSPLIGEFNAANLLTVLAVLLVWDLDFETALDVLGKCAPPPGRMESFGGGAHQPLAIVDYAHTPDALAKSLRAARTHCTGRLWCVFGCGGDRDRAKRPLMGEIAASLADRVILTDDNPRSEDADLIVAEILAGIPARDCVEVQRDRRAAIAAAISAARPGEAVLVAGKGHEDRQSVRGESRHFSDREEVARLLEAAQ